MDEAQRPAWRHPGWLLLYAFLAIVLAEIMSFAFSRMVPPHKGGIYSLVTAIAVAVIFIGIYECFCKFVEGRPPRELAFRFAPLELSAGIVIGVALFSAIVGVIWALGGYRVIGHNGPGVLVTALAIAIGSGFTEEIIFRGFFFRLTEEWLGSWSALILSAVLFGALHLGNTNASLIGVVGIMFEAGIMLAAIYMLTRRLWMAIGLHGAWNFAQGGIFGISVSGGGMDGLLRPDMRGPDWLTGGAFGAEASLPAIGVATAFGLGLCYVAYRRGAFIAPLWVRRRQSAAAPAAHE